MAISIGRIFNAFTRKGAGAALDKFTDKAVKNKAVRAWLEARNNLEFQAIKSMNDAECGSTTFMRYF